jgi:predicted PurR-regulated permease PerM
MSPTNKMLTGWVTSSQRAYFQLMRFRVSRRFFGGGHAGSAPPSPRAQPPPQARAEPPLSKMHVPPVVVPRWVQLVLLPLALLGLWALARAAGPVLLILIAASTVALILNPLVKMLERGRVPRGLAILAVYVGILAALVGVGILLADPVSTQVNRFAQAVPGVIKNANHDLANFQTFLNRHGIKVQVQKQGQTALQTLQKDVLKSSGSIVSFSQSLLGKVITLSFDFVLVLVLSVYLLVYGREIGDLVRRVMPPGDGSPEDDYPRLVQRAVFGYVRGQLLFSLIMGTSAGVSLWIIGTIGIFPAGAHYAVFFGAFYGLMELIPYVGPILGALPAVIVALFNDPISALWVTVLFVALQQLEGHVVAPQVFRISLRINPILIILSLLIGFQLYGVAGALVALPSAAVIRETVMYLRRHLVLEPWVTAGPGAGLGAPESPPSEPEPEAEPESERDLEAAYPLPRRLEP